MPIWCIFEIYPSREDSFSWPLGKKFEKQFIQHGFFKEISCFCLFSFFCIKVEYNCLHKKNMLSTKVYWFLLNLRLVGFSNTTHAFIWHKLLHDGEILYRWYSINTCHVLTYVDTKNNVIFITYWCVSMMTDCIQKVMYLYNITYIVSLLHGVW